VANRRTRHQSTTRTTSLLLILIALLFALLVAATPASAYEDWEHGGAKESTCDSSGCHKDKPATNTACVGCHSGYTTSAAQKCWDCHEPGAAPPVSCAGSCHLFQANGDNPAYPTAFSHGVTPHLGASGYGKTCVDCHGAGNVHHDAGSASAPACATCHKGTFAKQPSAAHATRSSDCASCHDGMSIPTLDCSGCHVGNPSSGGPQVIYSNSPACGDAGCHGKVKNHVGTSISAAACTTCHAEHYKSLGACTKCHADPQSFHHGAAQATPLADCATCHNGSIAAAPKGHAGYGTACASCHTGMNKPPSDCLACHDKAQGGVPAVVYTNDLTCGNARCHSMVPKHSGTPIKNVACTTCHTAHYEGLGSCATCHTDPQRFHHGTAKATPLADCAGCHNGTLASGHGNHGTLKSCTPCHGAVMKRPSVPGVCVTCHDVGTTTPTSCLASGCHTSTQLHTSGPAGGVDCTTCHKAHFTEVAPCTTCHPDRAGYHHKGVKTTPLADCTRCHDGKIASAKKAHDGQTCVACHTGMATPPVPATCQNCHDAQTFGDVTCTTCHSTTGMIGKETIHAKDPAATVSCTTCHKAHYRELGTCDSCHGSHAETHHGTATLADTRLKLAVTPAIIKAHKKATLKGSLWAGGKALASQRVVIQARKLKGGSFKKVATVKTRADGRFSRVVRPRVGTEYRAVWRPAGAYVVQQRPAVDTVKLRVRK
jgi:hypothetical protein